MKSLIAFLGFGLVSFSLLSATGCGTADPAHAAIAAVNKTNIERVANLYNRYQIQNQWEGPESVESLKTFIGKLNDKTLERMNVDRSDLGGLFVSERDGEPLKIKFSQKGSGRSEPIAVVFEQTGVDGKRMVGFSGGPAKEVDESEYNKLWGEE